MAKRQRLGDWWADIIICQGKQQAIVTLTERKSHLTLLKKVNDRTTKTTTQAMIELLKPFTAQTLLTDEEIARVEMRLNYRTRKNLGFSSPYMVFFQVMIVALGT